MAQNNLNLPLSNSAPASPGHFDNGHDLHHENLSNSYMNWNALNTDPLGISYGQCHFDNFHEFSSSYATNDETDNGSLFQPSLFTSNTSPPQSTFHIHEPTPITPLGPPRLFTKMPANLHQRDQSETCSPASYVSASPVGYALSRSQSFSGIPAPVVSAQQYATPATVQLSPTITPRQPSKSPSPLLSALRRPEQRVASPARTLFTPIAPHPAGVQQLNSSKHSYDDEDFEYPDAKKRRSLQSSPPSPPPNVDMSEEDRVLLRLKDKDGLTWKEIQTKFCEDLGKEYHIPALQMRFKRLRDRMRVWSDSDVHALRMAHQHFMETKFELIAAKMLEFGSKEKWTPKQCQRKWQDICWTAAEPGSTHQPILPMPPQQTASYEASPVMRTSSSALRMTPEQAYLSSY